MNAEGVNLIPAQGCARQRATLGFEQTFDRNPEGVAETLLF
jgi:hypothetical protein